MSLQPDDYFIELQFKVRLEGATDALYCCFDTVRKSPGIGRH